MFNSGRISIPDNFARIRAFSGDLLQVSALGKISAMDMEIRGQVDVPAKGQELKQDIAGLNLELFRFHPLEANEPLKGKIVLAMLGPTSAENYDKLFHSFFLPYKWRLLNSWLSSSFMGRQPGSALADAFITDNCTAPASGLLELGKMANGELKFFVLSEGK